MAGLEVNGLGERMEEDDCDVGYDSQESTSEESTSDMATRLLSTEGIEVIDITSESEEEDFPLVSMYDVLHPNETRAPTRPGLKLLTAEQQVESLRKFGADGNSLRRTVETVRRTKVTKVMKIQYRLLCGLIVLAYLWERFPSLVGTS